MYVEGKIVNEERRVIGYLVDTGYDKEILKESVVIGYAQRDMIDNMVYVNKKPKGYIRARKGSIPIKKVYSKGKLLVNEKDRRETSTTSKGNQVKWYKSGNWVKADMLGYEGLAEELSSIVLENTTGVPFIKYRTCSVKEMGGTLYKGCFSEDIVGKNEVIVSFARIIESKLLSSKGYDKAVKELSTKDRVWFLVGVVKRTCGIDTMQYIANNIYFDALTMNEDRHLNNLGVIENIETGKYTIMPIFDNGLSLLSDESCYGDKGIREAMSMVKSKPFSMNFADQVKAVRGLGGKPLRINKTKLLKDIEQYSNMLYTEKQVHRAKTVLKIRLQELEGIAWEQI